MTFLAVRLRRRGRTHAAIDDAESARQTLCDRNADGAAISTDAVDCKRCLRRMQQ